MTTYTYYKDGYFSHKNEKLYIDSEWKDRIVVKVGDYDPNTKIDSEGNIVPYTRPVIVGKTERQIVRELQQRVTHLETLVEQLLHK